MFRATSISVLLFFFGLQYNLFYLPGTDMSTKVISALVPMSGSETATEVEEYSHKKKTLEQVSFCQEFNCDKKTSFQFNKFSIAGSFTLIPSFT